MLFCYTSSHFIHSFPLSFPLRCALYCALEPFHHQSVGRGKCLEFITFLLSDNKRMMMVFVIGPGVDCGSRMKRARETGIYNNESKWNGIICTNNHVFICHEYFVRVSTQDTHTRTHESTHTYNNQINGARASRSKWIYWISDMPDIDINPNVTSIPSLLPPFCLSICFCVFVFQFRLNRMIWLQKHCPLSWRNSFVSNLAHTHT